MLVGAFRAKPSCSFCSSQWDAPVTVRAPRRLQPGRVLLQTLCLLLWQRPALHDAPQRPARRMSFAQLQTTGCRMGPENTPALVGWRGFACVCMCVCVGGDSQDDNIKHHVFSKKTKNVSAENANKGPERAPAGRWLTGAPPWLSTVGKLLANTGKRGRCIATTLMVTWRPQSKTWLMRRCVFGIG